MSTSADATSTDLSDLFAVDDKDDRVARTVPAATGFCEEEDAHRLIALQFNPDARFCRNCELYFEHLWRCPKCFDALADVGAAPFHRKRKRI